MMLIFSQNTFFQVYETKGHKAVNHIRSKFLYTKSINNSFDPNDFLTWYKIDVRVWKNLESSRQQLWRICQFSFYLIFLVKSKISSKWLITVHIFIIYRIGLFILRFHLVYNWLQNYNLNKKEAFNSKNLA